MPDWVPAPPLAAPTTYPPVEGHAGKAPRPPVQIGRRFLPWLLVLVLGMVSRVLRRSGKPAPGAAPSVVATRPALSPTPKPQPTATSQPARLGLEVERRNGRVVFTGSGFFAQVLDGVLHLKVLRPGGYGRVVFDRPPAAGPFAYTIEASRILGYGELLVTLTDPGARTTWNFAFNNTAGTWGITRQEQGKVSIFTVVSPRGYQELISGGKLSSVKIARNKGVIALSINETVIGDSVLEDLSAPLRLGVGAHMPRERIPADATRFSVLISHVALDEPNGSNAPA